MLFFTLFAAQPLNSLIYNSSLTCSFKYLLTSLSLTLLFLVLISSSLFLVFFFPSMTPSLDTISPRRMRSDLYSFSHQDDSTAPLVISVLASLLERAMARNERILRKCGWVSPRASSARVFDSHETPDMEIQSYLERIYRYAHVAPPVYVVAYVYIDRFCQFHPDFRITSNNVHRLLITTIMAASKFVEDMNYRNSYFARVGGLTTAEMNRLELDFLFLMGFKLQVSVSVFESYCCHLEREVSIGGGYQIERTLRLMCSREENTSSKGEKTTLGRRVTPVIGCGPH